MPMTWTLTTAMTHFNAWRSRRRAQREHRIEMLEAQAQRDGAGPDETRVLTRLIPLRSGRRTAASDWARPGAPCDAPPVEPSRDVRSFAGRLACFPIHRFKAHPLRPRRDVTPDRRTIVGSAGSEPLVTGMSATIGSSAPFGGVMRPEGPAYSREHVRCTSSARPGRECLRRRARRRLDLVAAPVGDDHHEAFGRAMSELGNGPRVIGS